MSSVMQMDRTVVALNAPKLSTAQVEKLTLATEQQQQTGAKGLLATKRGSAPQTPPLPLKPWA